MKLRSKPYFNVTDAFLLVVQRQFVGDPFYVLPGTHHRTGITESLQIVLEAFVVLFEYRLAQSVNGI